MNTASELQATIALIVGGILSFLFVYVPKFKEWYASMEDTKRALVNLGIMAVSAIAIVLLSCYNVLPYVPCTKEGIVDLIRVFVLLVVGNQSATAFADALAPKKVKSIRMARKG